MRIVLLALAFVLSMTGLGAAQGLIPERKQTVYTDYDFVGTDLQQLFDTTREACARACEYDDRCIGYTFNNRSNACFPKSSISDRTAYEGAVSVEMPQRADEAFDRAQARAAELSFLRSYDLSAALSQARALPARHPGSQWSIEAMLGAVREREEANDFFNAMRWMGTVTAQTDAAVHWTDYARLNLALNPGKSSDKRRYANEGLRAAINGYMRAGSAQARAAALFEMGRALPRLGRGRDSIPALKLAASLSAEPRIAAALAEARAKHGFRVVNSEVQSDLAEPRICAELTEELAKSEDDFARFVALPDPRLAVSAEGRKLCITGVSHGERVAFTLRAGLPAESGEVLLRDTALRFYVRDRAASVSFPGRSYILPLGGEAALPVETVNTDEVELVLRHVSDRNLLRAFQEDLFAKPLFRYQERLLDGEIGDAVWRGTGITGNALNETMRTRLPISEAIEDAPPGLYVMSARPAGAETRGATAQQWFVLSDIGLSTAAGNDGVHVTARSLASAQPLEGAEVQLISRANRVLGTAVTGADGQATFSAALTAGSSGSAPAMVLARNGEEDMAFLSLTDPAFDLSDRGVAGRNAPGAIDLFATTERGAYRAGDTVHATALLRDGTAKAIEGLPLTAVLLRPDGVEYARHLSGGGLAGGHVFSMPIAATAPRGAWTLELRSEADGPALASQSFLVEDFLPERIDYEVELDRDVLSPGAPATASVDARYLFGAPAADLDVRGRLRLSANRSLDAFPGYSFGPASERFSPVFRSLPAGETGAEGKAALPVILPKADARGLPLEARITLEVAEGSGRPVERSITRPVESTAPLIGLKPRFEGTVSEGTEAGFDILALSPERAPMQAEARWTLNRLDTRYQWYEQNGRWKWEPIVTRSEVRTGALTLEGGRGTVSTPVDWGRYELVMELAGGSYVTASQDFTAGWYGSGGAVDTPNRLQLSLDAESYAIGDEARLRVVPRAAGEAMVQVMSGAVISTQMVSLSAGENLIPLEVTEDWGAGAYVSVTHVTPTGTGDAFLPRRSIGLAYAKVDPGEKELAVTLDAPEVIKPRQPLRVTVRAEGVKAGETAHVTLAAVDAGILGLTGFEPPSPGEHYFSQRKLGVELRDVYGRLIDSSRGALGRIRSGGDAGADAGLQGPPPTDDLVTFFEGPVTLSQDGSAEIAFDLPEFNGTLRLMAVAWSASGVGSAARDVIVRDPVVLSASLPNFLSPGDESTLRLELTHADGPTGEVSLAVDAPAVLAGGDLPATLTLGEGAREVVTLPLRAGAPGDHPIEISLVTPSGARLTKSLTLPVRRLDPPVSHTRRLALEAGASLTLDSALTEGFHDGSARVMATAGPIAKFDVAGLLSQLDRYPYGCTEQLTSAAMPLLYFSEVSDALGLARKGDVAPRIEKALRRILTRQTGNGSFGLWYPRSGDLWLDAYVTDFLSRARAQGFDVPETGFASALANLQNRTNSAPDFDKGGRGLAYALYVLAREGQTSVADLRYYADVKGDAFDTPLARAQIGAALTYHGDQLRADAMFAKALALFEAQPNTEGNLWRSDYGTHRRDAAAVLALGQEAGSEAVTLAALENEITGGAQARSTQEMVWSLLAAHGFLANAPGLSLNGVSLELPVLRADHAALTEGRTLTNDSARQTEITLTTSGVPRADPEPTGYGYKLERDYYRMDGTPIETLDVAAGDRLVVHLKVRAFEENDARLIVDDPLPAGFEIDNPNLLNAGDIKALGWIKSSPTESTEFRAERFIAAVNMRGGKPIELAYIVRAVSPGRFHHAPALVEDMYRPAYRATTGAGEVVISAR
ncbi:alpha-2-macroglobulin family protein [Rhodobacteraceae bacterium 63075]|nr:alpha-2-macroglobulin family protein [Rhodobacteraceae bacterium 63075]